MHKILLAEDDKLLAESLEDFLGEHSFAITHEPNGQSAINRTFSEKFDLYLLDINLPLIDGITLLGELRDSGDCTPAIFLTSHKDKEYLQNAFGKGGDDYITKPFDTDELLLRIQALLKRSNSSHKNSGLTNDTTHKRIVYQDQELDLSAKEYELMALFMQHANKTIPKELILRELWSSEKGGSEGAIRVYVNRIKALVPTIEIQNIRGVGYKLVL